MKHQTQNCLFFLTDCAASGKNAPNRWQRVPWLVPYWRVSLSHIYTPFSPIHTHTGGWAHTHILTHTVEWAHIHTWLWALMLAMLIMAMMVKVISMRMELTISNDPKEDNQGTEWLNRTTENTGRVVRRRPAWLSSTTSMETVSSFPPRFSSLSSPPFAFLNSG